MDDETYALFGFGVDSFIEVISGIGIIHMIWRVKKFPDSDRDPFERTALRITGVAFYLLVAGLVSIGIYNIIIGHDPVTTKWGIIISLISIAVMWLLIWSKLKVGRKLGSSAIIADANCTKVCLYMSVVLLVSSFTYEFFQIRYIDSIGALGLAYFSFNEGRECFEKAKTNKLCACEDELETDAHAA